MLLSPSAAIHGFFPEQKWHKMYQFSASDDWAVTIKYSKTNSLTPDLFLHNGQEQFFMQEFTYRRNSP